MDLDEYQAELVRLDRQLVQAAAAGQYRRAGRVFEKLLKLQAGNAMLPTSEGYDEIMAQLNKIPSKVLGILGADA